MTVGHRAHGKCSHLTGKTHLILNKILSEIITSRNVLTLPFVCGNTNTFCLNKTELEYTMIRYQHREINFPVNNTFGRFLIFEMH